MAHDENLDEALILIEAVGDPVVAPAGRTAAAPWLGELLARPVRVDEERAGDQLDDGARHAVRKALEIARGAAGDHEPPGRRLAWCHLPVVPGRWVSNPKLLG